MIEAPATVTYDYALLRTRRAKPGEGARKAYLLEQIRQKDAEITHFIIGYQAGDRDAALKRELAEATRGLHVYQLLAITKD